MHSSPIVFAFDLICIILFFLFRFGETALQFRKGFDEAGAREHFINGCKNNNNNWKQSKPTEKKKKKDNHQNNDNNNNNKYMNR